MLSLHADSRQPIGTVVFRSRSNNTSRRAFSRSTQRQAGPTVTLDSPVTVPVVCQTRGLCSMVIWRRQKFLQPCDQRYSVQLRPIHPIIIDDLISLFAFALNLQFALESAVNVKIQSSNIRCRCQPPGIVNVNSVSLFSCA